MSSSDAVSTRPQACAKPELILPRSLCRVALPLLDAPSVPLPELCGSVLERSGDDFGGLDDDALVVDAVASELGLEDAGESW